MLKKILRKPGLSLLVSALAGISSCSQDHKVQETPHIEHRYQFNDIDIIGYPVKHWSANVPEKYRHRLPKPSPAFIHSYHYRKTQDSVQREIRDIVKLSMKSPVAVNYVRDKLKNLENYYDGNTHPIKLAKEAINIFREDLSTDSGKGIYTLQFEMPDKNNIDVALNEFLEGWIPDPEYRGRLYDTTQTLEQFISHTDVRGFRAYKGDCDDFSMGLLTASEIMIKLSKIEEGKFWKDLGEGLQRYRIIGVGITNHMMNASIEYSPDFRTAEFRPIEPIFYKNEIVEDNVKCKREIFQFINSKKWGMSLYILNNCKDNGIEKNVLQEVPVDIIFDSRTVYEPAIMYKVKFKETNSK